MSAAAEYRFEGGGLSFTGSDINEVMQAAADHGGDPHKDVLLVCDECGDTDRWACDSCDRERCKCQFTDHVGGPFGDCTVCTGGCES